MGYKLKITKGKKGVRKPKVTKTYTVSNKKRQQKGRKIRKAVTKKYT